MTYTIFKCKKRMCRETLYTRKHALFHYIGSLRKLKIHGKGKVHSQFDMIIIFEDKDIEKHYPLSYAELEALDKENLGIYSDDVCPFCNGNLIELNNAHSDEKDLIDLAQCLKCSKFILLTKMDVDDE